MSRDAVVVGAGITGLTAASLLAAAGRDVIVVEARDRIGGRTWTVDVGGVPVDLGGSWIHGPIGNPLSTTMSRLGLATRDDGRWDTGLDIFAAGRGWLPAEEVAKVMDVRNAWDPAVAAAELGGDASHHEGVVAHVARFGLDAKTAALAVFVLDWLEGAMNVGGDPHRISTAGSGCYVDLPGGNAVPVGGYRELVGRLAAGLDIRTALPVRSVRYGDGGVSIEASGVTIEADWAVVTLPLGVLQAGAVRFSPGLPIQDAVDRLATAHLEKIVFRFAERWWPARRRRTIVVTEDRRFASWVDMTEHAGAPTLLAFYNPFSTQGVARLAARDRIAGALSVLGEIYPDVPQPLAAQATDWAGDPYARGSYSYIPLGATAGDMEAIGSRFAARLILAGEHTVPEYFGTVHAAHVSGQRAAAAILTS